MQQLKLSEFNPLYQRYRFIALCVYMALLITGMIDWINSGYGNASLMPATESLRFTLFMISVTALISMEFLGVAHKSFEASHPTAWGAFMLRFTLTIIPLLYSDLNYTRVLFLLIVLYSYFAVSHTFSYFLSLVAVVALITLSISNPVLMGIVPAPPADMSSPVTNTPPMPQPHPPVLIGGLVDASMGSIILLFFTLLLARSMAQSLKTQQKLELLNASLEASHARLKLYATHVAELATTEERNRLARDIHDSLGHHLTAINIQLEKASAYKDRDPSRAFEAVQHAQRCVKDALADVRTSVSSLRKEDSLYAFDESVQSLIKRMQHNNLSITLEQQGTHSSVSKLTLMTLYRAIQEALTNVHKHANATHVKIKLVFNDKDTLLVFSDNGTGFDVTAWQANKASQSSYGLSGLQERLTLVDGQLSICSQPGETTLTVRIPNILSRTVLSA